MSRPVHLRASSLCKRYQVGNQSIHALRDVTFEVPPGKTLAVTGYSGSGKSTLLSLLGGLDRPTSGDVIFGNISLTSLSEPEITDLRRRSIGFVFQTFNLFPALTAYENVLLSGRIAGLTHSEASRRAKDILERIGMSARAKHRPGQLSGGEQQRVAIARALVFRPALLLADEPTGDLDSKNGRIVADLIFGLCREFRSTCVFATHNLGLAERADGSLSLKDGRVVEYRVPWESSQAYTEPEVS